MVNVRKAEGNSDESNCQGQKQNKDENLQPGKTTACLSLHNGVYIGWRVFSQEREIFIIGGGVRKTGKLSPSESSQTVIANR
jgi:hypothetical protein